MVRVVLEKSIQQIQLARGALANQKIALKVSCISSAYGLIESLVAAINPQVSASLAEQLYGVYEYCLFTLTKANLKNSDEDLLKVIEALTPLHQAWVQVEKDLSV